MAIDTEGADHVLHDMLREGGVVTVYLDCGAVFTGTLAPCRRAGGAWVLRFGNGQNRREAWFSSEHVQAIQKEV